VRFIAEVSDIDIKILAIKVLLVTYPFSTKLIVC